MKSPLESFNRWWESWRQGDRRDRLALADQTFDQSHSWHALFCAAFGLFLWLLWIPLALALRLCCSTSYGLLSARVWGFGVVAAMLFYLVAEISWRFDLWLASRRAGEPIPAGPAGMRWWDGVLDLLKPMWANLPLALVAFAGLVPGWAPAIHGALTLALMWLYSFGRPRGALLYDGRY